MFVNIFFYKDCECWVGVPAGTDHWAEGARGEGHQHQPQGVHLSPQHRRGHQQR